MANVYVVMGNDFPDRVFADEASADRYVKEKKTEKDTPRIYWRVYEFHLKD